jgi:hypothetical protein
VAEARRSEPARLVVGGLSGFPEAWERARAALEDRFGGVELELGPISFHQTDYYADEMGEKLERWFLAFARPIAQHDIAGIKRETNRLESEIAAGGDWPVPRPVNLDPGYVTLGKLVLATTKDQAHRLAVGEDIYAEVTLRYTGGEFEPNPWTYADYRQQEYLEFFARVRESLRAELRA